MNAPTSNALARALRGFFADYLPRMRGTSLYTLQSYRDSFVLFLRFLAKSRKRQVTELDIEDLGPSEVLDFLDYLEAERQNQSATRNVRLAAIHAFARYCATLYPDRLDQCQRILAVPFKRTGSRPIEYFEYDEIQAVLATVDRTTADGRRDYALLAIMFNTGARVQEIVALRRCDLDLEPRPKVRLFGKGRKERVCPIWPQTAALLGTLLAEHPGQMFPEAFIFLNHRGYQLTRFGVRYLLEKYCSRARTAAPSLRTKRLHPHSMRHSTAVYLLKSGVDIITISQWLGHASVAVTNRYATVDLDMKRKAIDAVKPLDSPSSVLAPWRTDASIIKWLEAL